MSSSSAVAILCGELSIDSLEPSEWAFSHIFGEVGGLDWTGLDSTWAGRVSVWWLMSHEILG